MNVWVAYTDSIAWAGEMAQLSVFPCSNIGCLISSSTIVKAMQKELSGNRIR
ncbi:hypothetical protein [Halotia branconii]|uniref:Uncharacterized protein n=1 Tax=Halotia branconii CENA392 TaxID=1539056 RepID=A0AAJ6NNB7_9CYAN|nr:hypothetical protein [Halotia branconii]WGV23558.1 hypothetical protein QI031_17235 [Halotia branconii CENA392]